MIGKIGENTKKHPIQVEKRFKAFKPFHIGISAITLAELEYGVAKSGRPEQNRDALIGFLSPLEIAVFDETKTKLLVEAFLQKAQKKLVVARGYSGQVTMKMLFHEPTMQPAQALLVNEGEKAQTHTGVVTLFGLLFVKTGKFDRKLGKYLANLKDDPFSPSHRYPYLVTRYFFMSA
ncbi:MAG: hypothetical protein A4E57_02807 [Syntrophorhabdaceae bacterium PtaU1.Bin034]|nr:MAG: hypothetical protein A4E57_02807 [Syntrophorhabdaceae bacterium PtaU1.Bin034]